MAFTVSPLIVSGNVALLVIACLASVLDLATPTNFKAPIKDVLCGTEVLCIFLNSSANCAVLLDF